MLGAHEFDAGLAHVLGRVHRGIGIARKVFRLRPWGVERDHAPRGGPLRVECAEGDDLQRRRFGEGLSPGSAECNFRGISCATQVS